MHDNHHHIRPVQCLVCGKLVAGASELSWLQIIAAPPPVLIMYEYECPHCGHQHRRGFDPPIIQGQLLRQAEVKDHE